MVWWCLLDICAWDQVCRSSSIQKASRIKVQRHGWITIDLCNVEDQQNKYSHKSRAPCMVWGNTGASNGVQALETVRSFETSTLMALGPTMESRRNSRSCRGKKGSGGVIFWEFHDGVFVVYWEYWISILTMRSMSSLWKNRIDMVYWIVIQCLNVFWWSWWCCFLGLCSFYMLL